MLDFSRVHFATVQCGMSVGETSFAIQKPRYLVEEYVKLIEEFGLDDQEVYQRPGVQIEENDGHIGPTTPETVCQNERREQKPITG